MQQPERVREEDREVPDIRFHGATILLAEDNASNREVIRAYLGSYNVRLVEVENGQEALDSMQHVHPDLVLIDIHMPVMDGYGATQRIKADPDLRTIPVVALTAYAMKDQKETYQDLYDAYREAVAKFN